MKNIISKFLLLLLFIPLAGCYEIHTEKNYTPDYRQGYATSKPIYLTIRDDKNSRIYLLLEKNMNNEKYFLKIRWEYKNRVKQFKGKQSTVSFFLDKELLLSEKPIKNIRTVSWNIDTGRLTQEAVYNVSRDDLVKIAYSKSVEMELEGKYENKRATFNKIHTFRAFKNFLNNS